MGGDDAAARHAEARQMALARYLNEICWAMGGTFAEQQALRDELRGHITEAARERELDGLSPDEALTATLRDFGPPLDLGRSMRGSRGKRPLARPLNQPAGALLLERRSVRHLPPLSVMLALSGAAVASVVFAMVYVWP